MHFFFFQGKGGKGQTKRKAPDELWTDGTVPERQNPLIHFLDDKLPREFLQQVHNPIIRGCIFSGI